MENSNIINIKLKKSKIINNIIVFIICFSLFLYMFLNPDLLVSKLFRSIYFIKIIGLICTLLSFLGIILNALKLFDNKVGLTITNEYILDNSVYESIGKIYWKDIENINIEKYSVLLNITKKFEEDYIKRLNLLKKIIIIIKKWTYKSSIIIASVNLDCSNEELYDYLIKGFLKYKESLKS